MGAMSAIIVSWFTQQHCSQLWEEAHCGTPTYLCLLTRPLGKLEGRRDVSQSRHTLTEGKEANGQVVADLTAFLAKVALGLERPNEVADHPVAEAIDVHLQLLVNLRAPRRESLAECFEAVNASEAEVADVVDGFLELQLFVLLNDHNHVVRIACYEKPM